MQDIPVTETIESLLLYNDEILGAFKGQFWWSCALVLTELSTTILFHYLYKSINARLKNLRLEPSDFFVEYW